jgi:uncharacterized membrane protein YfcA
MFGVGGGILMVPLLIVLGGLDQRRAAATSLVAIVPTAVVGVVNYGLRGELWITAAVIVACGAAVGSWCGSRILRVARLRFLQWAFVALLVAVGVWMALWVPVRGGSAHLSLLVGLAMAGFGVVMGLVSAVFGIGGGVIAVPVLMAAFGAGDLVARGTSLLIMIPTATISTIANVRGRLADLRGGLTCGITAMAASWAGSASAFLLSPRTGNLLFAALMAGSAVQLAVRARRSAR